MPFMKERGRVPGRPGQAEALGIAPGRHLRAGLWSTPQGDSLRAVPCHLVGWLNNALTAAASACNPTRAGYLSG
jgi:hypothetical protein